MDASSEMGYGHLMRGISIAEFFQKKKVKCVFALRKSDSKVYSILENYNIEFLILNQESDIAEINEGEKNRLVFLDVNNTVLFNNPGEYRSYVIFLKEHNYIVISFEEFSSDVFPVDVAIVPYVGADKLGLRDSASTKYLLGPEYFVFRQEFLDSPKVVIRDKVEHIFICMGGSDPGHLTEKYLGYLCSSPIMFNIKIIFTELGSLRRKLIEDMLLSYKGTYQIYLSPPIISSLISSCDIGIINSGLIKYETSILGLPSLSVSNNEMHEATMKHFADQAGIVHLGLSDEVTEAAFGAAISRLVQDVKFRIQLQKKNLLLLKGKGIEKIYKHIFNI